MSGGFRSTQRFCRIHGYRAAIIPRFYLGGPNVCSEVLVLADGTRCVMKRSAFAIQCMYFACERNAVFAGVEDVQKGNSKLGVYNAEKGERGIMTLQV